MSLSPELFAQRRGRQVRSAPIVVSIVSRLPMRLVAVEARPHGPVSAGTEIGTLTMSAGTQEAQIAAVGRPLGSVCDSWLSDWPQGEALRAYHAIRDAIVTGDLSPGERLVEDALALRLGYGRMSVRGALDCLIHDGLVIRRQNRGAAVRRISPSEAIEVGEARQQLEPVAAGLAAACRSADENAELLELLASLEEQLGNGDLLTVAKLDRKLQRRIVEISRHAVLIGLSGRLQTQMSPPHVWSFILAGRSDQLLVEKTAIVHAITTRDRLGAHQAMRAHLGNMLEILAAMSARDTRGSVDRLYPSGRPLSQVRR